MLGEASIQMVVGLYTFDDFSGDARPLCHKQLNRVSDGVDHKKNDDTDPDNQKHHEKQSSYDEPKDTHNLLPFKVNGVCQAVSDHQPSHSAAEDDDFCRFYIHKRLGGFISILLISTKGIIDLRENIFPEIDCGIHLVLVTRLFHVLLGKF